jgi:integrase
VNPSELAQKRLDQITRRDCMRFSSGIAGSPGTVRRVMAFLSVLFSEAIEAGILDVNPCHRLKLPAVPRRNNRVLAAHEAIRLMNPPEGDLYREMLFVYMRTGFRRSELCRAQHRDLTSDNRIWVRGTKNVVSATTHPISDDVAAVLRRQPIRSEFLFTTEQGQPVKPGTISQWFRRNKAKLGLPPEMRLHDLRGTYITLLIESGADIKTAQVLGRHATISQTAEVYAQSHFETQDEALLNMAEHIQKRSRDRAKKAAAAGQGELF